MGEHVPRADFFGPLKIGKSVIDSYVLVSGGKATRILSTRGVMKSLGRRWRGRKYAGTKLPVFLEAKNLKTFIDTELDAVLTPIVFRTNKGALSEGYIAEMLPRVCDVFLKAREEGALLPSQLNTAKQCEILVRGLATVGIIALVDAATGYERVRDSEALQAILDKYITDEWAKWTKTFPDEFYKELFRLKGIPYPPIQGKSKRPSYVGHWTNDIIYTRLAPGVLDALRKKNPRLLTTGERARRFHQHLTRDFGHPELRDLLANVIFLMRGCNTWQDFKRLLERAAPKYGDTIPMDLPE